MATCPKCQTELLAADINVGQNVAFCRGCGEIQKLSDLAQALHTGSSGHRPVDFSKPPRGTWYRDEGSEVVFGATTRSWIAIAFVPFAAIWLGMVGTFTVVALAATLGKGSGPAGVIPLLFMIPFWIVGCVLLGNVAMMLVGRVEVRLRGTNGEVFTGVGSIGRRRRFDLAEFDRVVERDSRFGGPSIYGMISLEGQRRLSFGLLLNEERRYFLATALRTVIEGRG